MDGGARSEFDAFYAAFSERFRGPYDLVKRRLRVHAEYLKANGGPPGPLLDLGVGRGEWLAIAAEFGWPCTAVDHNPKVVAAAKAHGFDVIAADAFDHMRTLPAESLGAVTAFHIIEHLEAHDQVRLFREAFRLLKPSGYLILEWPNPEHPRVSAYSFWLDPTHRVPLPHELLAFMAEYSGFTDMKLVRLDDGKPVDKPALDIALIARKPNSD
ncbi:MAG TPA: class I SAM-dependent methyltransferase [Candidatus Eremiobacteraceae bacterium]|nr:class I SAM-dependent methyltransferase [Candidatus Eremiobacteraceae bacterium]